MKKKKLGNELNDLLTKAQLVRKELKHDYLGTEHVIPCVLEIEYYQNLMGVSKEEYIEKVKEIIGVGGKTEINTAPYTPLLEAVLYECKTIMDFMFYLLIECQEGAGYRVLENLIRPSDFEVILENLEREYNDNKPLSKLPVYLTNLNEKEYVTNPAIGRDIIIEDIEKILLKMNKPNVLLIGDAGVGKTAIVEGLAYKIKNGEVSEKLKNKVVLEVATSALLAGTKYRGEFEEKIQEMCNYIKKNKRVILFIDEMHTTVKAGGAEGAVNMANILKPYLARGEIKVIGATTLEESKEVTADSAYDRRFTKILVKEPTIKTVYKILKESAPKFEKFYGIKIDSKLLDFIADKSLELAGELPDKAIDLLENVCADTAWHNDETFTKKDIQRVLEEVLERNKELQNV